MAEGAWGGLSALHLEFFGESLGRWPRLVWGAPLALVEFARWWRHTSGLTHEIKKGYGFERESGPNDDPNDHECTGSDDSWSFGSSFDLHLR